MRAPLALVSGDGDASSSPAEENSLVSFPTTDLHPYFFANIRPTHCLSLKRTRESDIMTSSLQLLDNKVGQYSLLVASNSELQVSIKNMDTST